VPQQFGEGVLSEGLPVLRFEKVCDLLEDDFSPALD